MRKLSPKILKLIYPVDLVRNNCNDDRLDVDKMCKINVQYATSLNSQTIIGSKVMKYVETYIKSIHMLLHNIE